MQPDSVIDAVLWAGRQQAFALIAAQSTAAQVRCLRNIHETRAYEAMGLSWEEFCPKHAGMSRVNADNLIRRLNEFGEKYFQISDLTHIGPETYRQIAGHVHDDALDLDGESIPLTPENAPRIREAIRTLRSRVRAAEGNAHRSIIEFQVRMDAVRNEVSKSAERPLPLEHLAALRGFATSTANKWRTLAKRLDAVKPVVET